MKNIENLQDTVSTPVDGWIADDDQREIEPELE
jgi:hypothetical protein